MVSILKAYLPKLVEIDRLYRKGVITLGEYHSQTGAVLMEYEKALWDAHGDSVDIAEWDQKIMEALRCYGFA